MPRTQGSYAPPPQRFWLPVALALAGLLLLPHTSTALQCDSAHGFPCCTGENDVDGSFYCNGTAQVFANNVDVTITRVVNGTFENVECKLEFDYDWDTACTPNPATRTLRICAQVCAGDSGSCSVPSCYLMCQEFSEAEGHIAETLTALNVAGPLCWYCRMFAVDVEGNEACYPPNVGSNCSNGSTCFAGCGAGLAFAQSVCLTAGT